MIRGQFQSSPSVSQGEWDVNAGYFCVEMKHVKTIYDCLRRNFCSQCVYQLKMQLGGRPEPLSSDLKMQKTIFSLRYGQFSATSKPSTWSTNSLVSCPTSRNHILGHIQVASHMTLSADVLKHSNVKTQFITI